jgi:hypothetical protein
MDLSEHIPLSDLSEHLPSPDSSEHIPTSDGILTDFSVEEPEVGSSFGPRLCRALVMLTIAVSTHVWLVRAPHARAALQVAGAAAVSHPGFALAQRVSAHDSVIAAHGGSVHVRTAFVHVNVDAGAPPTVVASADRPVGTTGVVPAQSDIPGRDRSGTSRVSPKDSRVAAASGTLANGLPVLPAVGTSQGPAAELAPRDATSLPLALASRVEPAAIEPISRPVVAAVDHSAQLRADEETVRRVLLDYTRAFEKLDVQAAKAIWPSVDGRALQRAFQQLDGQQLRFESCGVSVSGRDANARCRGDATYHPKVGSRVVRLTEREWTFNLSRDNDRWQIVKATLQ